MSVTCEVKRLVLVNPERLVSRLTARMWPCSLNSM